MTEISRSLREYLEGEEEHPQHAFLLDLALGLQSFNSALSRISGPTPLPEVARHMDGVVRL